MIKFNKKLIFDKFFLENTYFFLLTISCLSITVWIIQAVNFLDFVTEDGHGFKVYFFYTFGAKRHANPTKWYKLHQ